MPAAVLFGSTAGRNLLHELFHDGRHLNGAPCHWAEEPADRDGVTPRRADRRPRAAAVSIAFDLIVAERVVDRAVAHGSAAHASAFDHAPLAVPAPFSRRGQRGGLVLGELLLAGGIAFLVAGATTLLSPPLSSPLRLWILAGNRRSRRRRALPRSRLPAVAAGVASGLEIGDRQRLYLVTVGLGSERWPRPRVASRSWRGVVAAVTCLVVPVLLAVALLPASGRRTRSARTADGAPRGVDSEPDPVLGRAHRGRRAAAASPGPRRAARRDRVTNRRLSGLRSGYFGEICVTSTS